VELNAEDAPKSNVSNVSNLISIDQKALKIVFVKKDLLDLNQDFVFQKELSKIAHQNLLSLLQTELAPPHVAKDSITTKADFADLV
jgi:hypothetical protein